MANTSLSYQEDGAARAAEDTYREDIIAADSVDLSSPLPVNGAANKGLQSTGQRQNIAVSIRFTNPTDSADVYLVTWHPNSSGDLVPLGVQVETGVAPGSLREGATEPYFAPLLFFDAQGAAGFEVRFLNVVGCAKHIRAWSF